MSTPRLYEADTSVEGVSGALVFVDLDISSLDDSIVEMKDIYKERLPYVVIPTLDGQCYRWGKVFLYNCLLAMSTDALVQFTQDELDAWWSFVNFEDFHSHSALKGKVNGLEIGCTNPNEDMQSCVVTKHGLIHKGILCENPTFEVLNEVAWKSLDKAFMALYNCEDVDDCDRVKEIKEISTCDMYNRRDVTHNGRQVVINEDVVIFTK